MIRYAERIVLPLLLSAILVTSYLNWRTTVSVQKLLVHAATSDDLNAIDTTLTDIESKLSEIEADTNRIDSNTLR
jgi:hypothetical protein